MRGNTLRRCGVMLVASEDGGVRGEIDAKEVQPKTKVPARVRCYAATKSELEGGA